MKPSDQYPRFVQWSDEDQLYIGYCPDLFFGGACHNENEIGAYAQLCEIVEDVVDDLIQEGGPLPPVVTNLVPVYACERVAPPVSAASV